MSVRKKADNKDKIKLGYKKLAIKQVASTIGRDPRQLKTLRTLGLGKIGRVVEQYSEPSIVGKLRAVSHLVEVREVK